MNEKLKRWLPLLGIAAVLVAVAAVPGIFSSVNSTSGYQVNGSAGSSGQALCSDGTYFDTPCAAVGGVPVVYNGTAMPLEPALGLTTSFYCADNTPTDTLCDLAAVGTAGTYAFPISLTTDNKGRVTSVTAGTDPTANDQYLLAQSTCTPATSTDADCTGTITLSPGWSDASYSASAQMFSSAGAHMAFIITSKSAGSFNYNLSCAFNCSSYGTMSVDVHTHHS